MIDEIHWIVGSFKVGAFANINENFNLPVHHLIVPIPVQVNDNVGKKLNLDTRVLPLWNYAF